MIKRNVKGQWEVLKRVNGPVGCEKRWVRRKELREQEEVEERGKGPGGCRGDN